MSVVAALVAAAWAAEEQKYWLTGANSSEKYASVEKS